MKLTGARVSALCACFATALAGCAISVEPPPLTTTAAAGEVSVNWLVGGSSRPDACDRVGAAALELVVYDASGRPVTRQVAPCGAFSLTVSLPEGSYTADATLIDPAGRTRSATRTMGAVDVIQGTNLAINLDFPFSSLR